MTVQIPAREAPAAPPLAQPDATAQDPSFPAVPDEPVLNIDNIQGNILGGFNKDFQTLLFLKIHEGQEAAFKEWLGALVPFIASAAEVLSFNQLFKAIRTRRGESRTVQATWINIAFSYKALTRLATGTAGAAGAFADEAFVAGLAARSGDLGDPEDASLDGRPATWLIGGPDNEADVVLIFAGDDAADLAEEVARIEDSIYAGRTPAGTPFRSGVQVLFKQHGAVLPPPLRGHEHFGFLDGVSQPGIRGRLSANPADVLTPRQNPNDRNQGKPGQDLLWPGEFVFGYKKQDPQAHDAAAATGPVATTADNAPDWTRDGSYLVFRRLRQDVNGFHAFVQDAAQQLGASDAMVGATLVGRWASGAPLLRAQAPDNATLASDDCANNSFEFQSATPPLPTTALGSVDCADPSGQAPTSPGDQAGHICPFSAHIRKAYPRDDVSTNPYPQAGIPPLSEPDTQTHRLLRRGIPFGEPSRLSPGGPELDAGDRGLLFLAYQTSIVNQFEFVTKHWINESNFKDQGVGLDPLLGQRTHSGTDRQRQLTVSVRGSDGSVQTKTLDAPDFVTPTGGGYFFAPSLSALHDVLAAPGAPT